jgi:hypothetical protein
MFGNMPCVRRALPRRGNQYHTLDGIADGNHWSNSR